VTVGAPDVQLIANLVVCDDTDRVLFVRPSADESRWWLPGLDLAPYAHPDDVAAAVLAQLDGVEAKAPVLAAVDSFRGRRGWHVVFHYLARATATAAAPRWAGGAGPDGTELASDECAVAWFGRDALPRTMHGNWESDVVRRVLAT
jgi:ADP-ribose pyrophosphatase YjhB (NUDIX family)